MSDYQRIAQAIAFIQERVADQPDLEEMAAHLHLSPFHFQRLFRQWAGITPKRFLQMLTLEQGKALLSGSQLPLSEVSASLGLSGSSRLYGHFVTLEALTPGEFRHRAQGIRVQVGWHPTPFGTAFIAMTARGICRIEFPEPEHLQVPLQRLQAAWPRAVFSHDQQATERVAEAITQERTPDEPVALSVTGTNFQVAVWRALLQIPPGAAVSYSQLAAAAGYPTSARAVGNAVGANPVAVLIPCHRVIKQSGALGNYRWGSVRKQAIQCWEKAQCEDRAPQ